MTNTAVFVIPAIKSNLLLQLGSPDTNRFSMTIDTSGWIVRQSVLRASWDYFKRVIGVST